MAVAVATADAAHEYARRAGRAQAVANRVFSTLRSNRTTDLVPMMVNIAPAEFTPVAGHHYTLSCFGLTTPPCRTKTGAIIHWAHVVLTQGLPT